MNLPSLIKHDLHSLPTFILPESLWLYNNNFLGFGRKKEKKGEREEGKERRKGRREGGRNGERKE